jgi:nitrite reductase (NADH) large subunit
MKKRLAIIGNGLAAGRLLDELLRRNATAAMDVTVFGEEPHGLYNRILISRLMDGGTQDEITLKPPAWYADRGIVFRAGVLADRLDAGARLLHASDGTTHPYDIAVFATGSRPLVPPLPGLTGADGKPKAGAFVYRTADDSRRIREHARPASSAVVLGGGLLGLEAAKSLSDLGMHVTVVQQGETLMNAQVDALGGQFVRKAVERLGVFVRTGAGVASVTGTDRVEAVVLANGDVLTADMLVLACGVRPRVDAAVASGIPVRAGIVVNDTMATAVPGVYAVGECAEHAGKVYGIVTPIWEQCAVAADILSGANPQARYRGSRLYTRLKVAGVEVASMGCVMPAADTDEVIQVVEERRGIYRKLVVRDGRLVGAVVVGESESPAALANRLDVLCTGDVSPAAADPEVCNCHHVCQSTIVDAIRDGRTTLPQLAAETKAGTGCGSCRGQLANLILANAPRNQGGGQEAGRLAGTAR